MNVVTGIAAGVPFTALPPAGSDAGRAPLIVTWHMLDAPRTDAAFAAALPMTGIHAWRVHLGMPMCGSRMVDGRADAVFALAREDALRAFLAPFVHQAVAEFPAALASVRDQLPVNDGPVGVVGASLGGAVALQALATGQTPLGAVALVNPAVRIRSAVPLVEAMAGHPYSWSDDSERIAAELDFVARVTDFAMQPPMLIVSGEDDHPAFRSDAADFVSAFRAHHARPSQVELVGVANLAHPLAEEPGIQPAPQLPAARRVNDILTQWFSQHLTSKY